MSQTWKNTERAVASALGGKRHSRGSDFGASAPDIDFDKESWLCVECKHRKKISKFLVDAIKQAKMYAKESQLPIAVIHEKNMRFDNSLVVMTLKDFKDFFI